MKVRSDFTFDETQLRTVRAAIGRGGKATRKECRVFIARAISTALDAAPEPKAKRAVAMTDAQVDAEIRATVDDIHARRYPNGCPMLCEACATRLGIEHETEAQRIARVRRNIERKFGHAGTGVARG